MILTLALLASIRIAFVFRGERPRLWGRSEEHLRDLHPIAAVSASKERLCESGAVSRSSSTSR